jgi:uncharacterized membrane protein
MTLVNERRIQKKTVESRQHAHLSSEAKPRRVNVGASERAVSVAVGAILTLAGLSRRNLPGLLVAGIGGAMTHRGLTGKCHMYDALGVDTAKEDVIHIEQAMLVDRPQEELYRFWRNFENLPSFMTHVKSVTVLNDRRSHWVADGIPIDGGRVEWEAEVTVDEPNERIAWRTLPGSDVDHSGEVRFRRALGERGTEVHAYLDYNPPAGTLGHWIAKLSGRSPDWTLREDLRNFKRLMECGEIPTIVGQPQGKCVG